MRRALSHGFPVRRRRCVSVDGLQKADETALRVAAPERSLGNHNSVKRKMFYGLVLLIPSG